MSEDPIEEAISNMNLQAMEAALLDQYRESEEFMHRFLISIQSGGEISRTESIPGFKQITFSELRKDLLSYFIDNKNDLEKEFAEELLETVEQSHVELFCVTIREHWYDGRSKRHSGPVQQLKRAVYDYLKEKSFGSPAFEPIGSRERVMRVTPLLPTEVISSILTVTNRLLGLHVDEWISKHPRGDEMGRGNIYLRRGLGLKEPLKEKFEEHFLINSYSLAMTVTEQFSKIIKDATPAIVQSDF